MSAGSDSVSGRYSRSVLFPGIGPEGQARIGAFSIAFVGVGAVGAAAAESAARAGFGRIRLIDRDVVEESNLARQFLYDARDAAAVSPKAEAAARRLGEIAPGVAVSAVVADLDHRNARELLSGHDVVFDASDNFETRLLVSDAARALGLPSIYAGCVGSEGLVAVSVPGRTPCLRCYLEAAPPAGDGPTCDTAGIVPTLPPLVAAAGMTEALRLAVGQEPSRGIWRLEVWKGALSAGRFLEASRPSPRCPVCSGPDSRRSTERAPRRSSSSAGADPCRWRRGDASVRTSTRSRSGWRVSVPSTARRSCFRRRSKEFT